MSFQSCAREYLQALQVAVRDAEATSEATSELSFRAPLDGFLRNVFASINPDSAVILEPKRRASGAPDFRVHDQTTLGVFGFIEAKGPEFEKHLDSTFLNRHSSQIERYRELGYRVIATDGLDFFLFDPDKDTPDFASLVDKPLQLDSIQSATIHPEVYPLLTTFLAQPTFRIVNEQGLVEFTARHAREIARTVAELAPLPLSAATDETEKKTIARLHEVHRAVSKQLDPHLASPQSFGGFVAQVLAFSLLYAHRVEHQSASNAQGLYNKLVAWGHPNNAKSDQQLRPFRELIRLLGDELKPGSSGDLGRIYDTLRTTLAYIVLPPRGSNIPDYHTLYESFLEKFDSSLRDRYGAYYTPSAVAEASVKLTIRAINFKGNKKNKVIEPCCGTGSFIDALQSQKVQSPIIGLEVLPSAYALACFRQSLVGLSDSKVHIALTNTLADGLLADEIVTETAQGSLFELEQSEVRTAIKPPVVLVIGNPPASDVSTSNPSFCSYIYHLLKDFRPSVVGARENKQKQTTSTAMQFLRWSAERVIRNGSGAISLLMPSSFVDKPSFRVARQWLRGNFGRIWVLVIDGDARAGFQSNIFQVRQGRALVIAELGGLPEVKYADITSLSRSEKIEWLSRDAQAMLQNFLTLPNDESFLRPTAKLRHDWSRMKPLWSKSGEGVFIHQCSGVKLAPTSIFVNIRESILRRRICDLANFKEDIPSYIEKWFNRQAKPPAREKFSEPVVKGIIGSASLEEAYADYSFRPFLTIKAMISPKVLKSLSLQKNSGTRYRPEHQVIFAERDSIAIGITPAPSDVSDFLGHPAVLIRSLPDNDLSRRGNIRVLSARSPGNKRKKGWGTLFPNVNPALIRAYESAGKSLGISVERAMVFYAYAVLSSQWYLAEWNDQLMECSGDELPRIPLPSDMQVFCDLVKVGTELERVESQSLDDHNELSEFIGFKLERYQVSDNGDLELLDQAGQSRLTIQRLGAYVDFEVGGYSVVGESLKWMTFKYLRAEISTLEALRLYSLRDIIEAHDAIQPRLSSLVQSAIASDTVALDEDQSEQFAD